MKLAIVGATGAVGREALQLAERSDFVKSVGLFASAKSARAHVKLPFRGEKLAVADLATADLSQFDIAIFSAGSKVSKEYAPRMRHTGCTIIDNSSAFRMHEGTPLVVPEINPHAIRHNIGIIANPNCTTAITLMALWPLHKAFGLKRFSATTYQAASGAGARGLETLRHELSDYSIESSYGNTWPPSGTWKGGVFPHPLAVNVIPQVGSFLENGSTDEEMKMLNEGRKIMELPSLMATTTCVRVPVERVHCIDVLAEFERAVDLVQALHALRGMPGLDVFTEGYPTPLEYAGKLNCGVGRVRIDQAFTNALRFWVAGDQLLKGAALNAMQIAERLTH